MPSHYTLRMQFSPKEDPEDVKRQLLDLVRTTPVDEVMFFFFAEEYNNGHETLDEIKHWLDRSRPYRDALEAEGVVVSANPWHTLLHADRRRRLKPGQDWQTMVDFQGRQATAQVCPLDPGWREYYAAELALYAREGFRVVWIDDDVRLHNHHPLAWGGCWCPLHVAEFDRRAGANATREEIVAKCLQPGRPHPWREIWMDMNEDMYFEMISSWREILAAGGTRLGLMSSYVEAHAAEGRRWQRWWRAFSGGGTFVHRPPFCEYIEATGDRLANWIATLDQMRSIHPADVESGPEIDNGPYGEWQRSYRQTGAAVALAHVLGSTNLNISLFDFLGNRIEDEPGRAAFLREWRPAADRLADEFPMTLRSRGIGIPWSEDMGRRTHTEVGRDWKELEVPTRGWSRWLLAAGHAVQMRPSESVNALAGKLAWAFDDDEIRGWLGGDKGLLLDGTAAMVLVERGFGDLIGVASARMITQEDALFTHIECTDADFSLHKGALLPLNPQETLPVLLPAPAAGARVISDLMTAKRERIGPAEFLFENRLGGRVAVVPWDANAWFMMHAQRAVQLAKVLAWLDPRGMYGSVEGGAWLLPQFLTDGRTHRAVVWNACGDSLSRFTLHAPKDFPALATALQIDAHGKVCDDAKVGGGVVTLARPLAQWECVVMM